MRTDAVTGWWLAAHTASRARIAYETALALLVTSASAGLHATLGLPGPAIAAYAVLDLMLIVGRSVIPGGALIVLTVLAALFGRLLGPLLVVLSWSAGHRSRSAKLIAVLAVAAGCYVTGAALHGGGYGPTEFVLVAEVVVVFVVTPAVVARLSAQRRQILDRFHQRTTQLAKRQRTVADQVRAFETTRIAREMHDSLGHRLTLLILHADALTGEPRDKDALELVRRASRASLEELRRILDVLGAEPRGTGLAGVDDLVTDARRVGTTVELVRDGEPASLSPAVGHAAYRTVQEGLTNALRHARGAPVRVFVRYEPDALIVGVVNGTGEAHDAATSGRGLSGLAATVQSAGGVLHHAPRPDGGWRTAATLPSNPPPSRPAAPGVRGTDEAGDALHRAEQRRRIRAGLVVAGLAVTGVAGLVGFAMIRQEIEVSQDVYDTIGRGDDEAAVRAKLPARTWAQVTENASCVAYAAQTRGRYRFCFRAGVLVSKVPLAPGTP